MGNVVHTKLRVVNHTDSDIITTVVFNYDNYDWEGSSRVNNNFSGAYIAAGDYKEENENLNGNANNNPFSMTLKFKDGTVDTFRINMLYAECVNASANFNHSRQSHKISYRRILASATLVITVESTDAQKSNIEAEKHNTRGKELMKKKRYEQAKQEFDQAKNKATKSSTIHEINYNRRVATNALEKKKQNDKAIRLNNQGLQLARNANYQLAKKKYTEALTFANESATVSLIEYNLKAAGNKENNARATQLVQEGEEEMKKERYENAVQKFEQASVLANDYWTVRSATQNLKKAQIAYEPEKLNKEGLKLVMLKKYQEATEKFNEALAKTTDATLISTINQNMNFMGKHQSNNKAIRLNNQGLVLMRSQNYEAAIKKYDEALKFAYVEATVSYIEYNKQAALNKQRNAEAEKLNQEGETEMKKHNYREAMQKLEKASKMATDHWTTRNVAKNLSTVREMYVQEKISQGEDLTKQKRFADAVEKFDDALKVATKEEDVELIFQKKNIAVAGLSENEQAAKLNSEGMEELMKRNYEGALKKFEEASKLANQPSTVAAVKVGKSETYRHYGEQLLQESLLLESDTSKDQSEQALKKLQQAEEMFRNAESLHHTAENEVNLKNVKVKNVANGIFNQGVLLETEAYELFDDAEYSLAKKKFEEALEKYEEVAKKLGEVSVFGDSLRVAEEQIVRVKEDIRKVKTLELENDIKKIHSRERTGEEVNDGGEEHNEESRVDEN